MNFLFTVMIVGKPNVGKSSLFNKLIRKNKAITDDTPGVTRDAVYGEAIIDGAEVRFVDTCGLFSRPQGEIESKMRQRTIEILDQADLLLFVVSAQDLPTQEDHDYAEIIRKGGYSYLFVANKSESTKKTEPNRSVLYELGMGEPIMISAAHNMGLQDLRDQISEIILDRKEEAVQSDSALASVPNPSNPCIKVAIVGKPNSGKSSMFNAIIGKDRALVTSIPGTTRDSIDDLVRWQGKEVLFIDTAGMRRRSRVEKYTIESYSFLRAQKAIQRADVCILVIDFLEGITDQDLKIAGIIENAGKASIITINKMDLSDTIPHPSLKTMEKMVQQRFHFIDYSLISFVSALKKRGLDQLFSQIEEAHQSFQSSFSTGAINSALEKVKTIAPPPRSGKKFLKLYYATQVSVGPPIISIYVNDPSEIPDTYKKTLKRGLRKYLSMGLGSPLFLKFLARRPI